MHVSVGIGEALGRQTYYPIAAERRHRCCGEESAVEGVGVVVVVVLVVRFHHAKAGLADRAHIIMASAATALSLPLLLLDCTQL